MREIQHMGGDQYRQQSQSNREAKSNCMPTSIGDEILTGDNEYVNNKNIKFMCKCTVSELCRSFLRTGDEEVLEQAREMCKRNIEEKRII